MKSFGTLLFALLAPALGTARPIPTRDQPLTVVVTSLDSATTDAFIGNLRFANVRAIYAGGSIGSTRSAQRVATALGVRAVSEMQQRADASRDADKMAHRVLENPTGAAVVVLDSDLVLPFLRRVTNQPRSSFPLSGAPGRMWIVTLSSGYMSAVRGSY